MTHGAWTLSRWPLDPIEIVCDRCERRGRYRKATLLERYGGDVVMPEVLARVSADCPKRAGLGADVCGVRYAEAP